MFQKLHVKVSIIKQFSLIEHIWHCWPYKLLCLISHHAVKKKLHWWREIETDHFKLLPTTAHRLTLPSCRVNVFYTTRVKCTAANCPTHVVVFILWPAPAMDSRWKSSQSDDWTHVELNKVTGVIRCPRSVWRSHYEGDLSDRHHIPYHYQTNKVASYIFCIFESSHQNRFPSGISSWLG